MTKVQVDINAPKILANIGYGKGGTAQRFFNEQLLAISDAYAPFDIGTLKNSGQQEPSGQAISYNTPYARRQWYGVTNQGVPFNYHGAPVRGSRWVERAWNIDKQYVLDVMQSAQDRGMFK